MSTILLWVFIAIVLLALLAILAGLVCLRKRKQVAGGLVLDMLWTCIPFLIVLVLVLPSLGVQL